MPAKDSYHDAVKNALIKDGWEITADPYPIRYQEIRLFADLAGEKTLSATKSGKQIVIEVKSFLGRSAMREFETALGQYLIYRAFLSVKKADYTIYLAIGKKIHEDFFQQKAIKFILQEYQVFLLVIDFDKEEIVEWIS
ncbi:XisH family protein [Oscillatoria salina]|uniref:XisH family protein n=1 Tax=Oscillatoria salina TaxID=331517 RepID=UPI001CCE6DC1|nr:XisH family protein [Oscillatoria salina]MBZ8179203.1 XisH protein [Oscillatoria salina IIICB1]